MLLDEMVRQQRPLPLGELTGNGGSLPNQAITVVKRLAVKGVVALDATAAIVAVYPISATPTRHRVRLRDGRTFHAMCAIDALGAAFTFKQDAVIASSCRQCDAAVEIHIEDEKIRSASPATVRVLHLDLRNRKDWAANC